MKTKTINVYQYKELSDKAKDKARDWFLSTGDDGQAWDSTKEDAANIGLDLKGTHHDTMTGDFEVSALDCAERILKGHGKHCETFKTASKYVKALRVKPVVESLQDAYEGIEHEFLVDICEDYRIILNKDYEYQQTEEYISEIMEANEYEFYEDGRRI